LMGRGGLKKRAAPAQAASGLCCALGRPGSAGSDAFTIRHDTLNKCIQVKNSRIVIDDCRETSEALWKWVSQNRLFHLGAKQCLGLDIFTKLPSRLRMVDCNSDLRLWWRCADGSVVGASQYKVTIKSAYVTASINASDQWRSNNSSGDICQYPYREVYTKDGNSYGRPCEFPFLYNMSWHHDCIQDGTHTGGKWCATSEDYPRDGKWGICLQPEDGCRDIWEHDAGSQHCYQFNTQSALSWKEAYISCQRQGGDLLSIQDASELNYIQAKDDIAEIFWIGLNQLDVSRGWQWSDHKPLNFVNWHQDPGPDLSPLDGTSCVAMNAASGQWQSYHCGNPLPYVCKKSFKEVSNLTEFWRHLDTRCDVGWLPHNGFCYMLIHNQASWSTADTLCKTNKSNLISIHSLADVELIVTKLHNDAKEEVWMGLRNEDVPTSFKWSDHTDVVFTYWDQNEPNVPFNVTPNCVSYSGKLGQWRVKSCEENLKYVCKKKGEILNETKSDKNCSLDEGWEIHGNYCYKILQTEVSFGALCNLTVTNRFEQEFINSLIRKHTKVEEKYFWTGLQDISQSGMYSWAAVDGEKSETVTYTNWNSLQPEFSGGCVVMSSGRSLGKWETKDCKTTKAFPVCKKYIGLPKEPEVLPKPSDPCPPGWHNGSGLACYKFFHSERVLRTRTWEEAERFCEALGGHLPSFTHTEEIKTLHSILRKIISNDRWVWIGMNKRSPDSLGTWQWSDDKPVNEYDTRDCVALKVSLKFSRRSFWRFYFHEGRDLEFYFKPFDCDAKLEWVCQITKGSTPKTPEWYIPDEIGIHGVPLVVDGAELWFVPDKNLSFQEAISYCQKNDSELASVESYPKLRTILSQIEKVRNEQKWWLKFIDYGYSYHSPYVAYYFILSLTQLDYPVNCNMKLPFICEKNNASLLEKHDPSYRPVTGGCPKGWLRFQNKCFLKMKSEFLTFNAANEKCVTFGGSLPCISSQAEQDFITSLLPQMPRDIWIGLQFLFSTRENKWIDESRLLYSNFHPLLTGRLRKIPLDLFDEEFNNQCGVILNDPKSQYVGTWNFTACADRHFLGICQRPIEVQPGFTPFLNDTFSYQNVQYKIILKNLTWNDAMAACINHKMQLVSITDQFQQASLAVQAALHDFPLWIGLFSRDGGKHYGWLDGKHVSFSRWSEDDEETSEECVYLDTDGFWKTSDCYSENRGAICYSSEKKNEKEQVTQVKCPHKIKNTPWISFRNNCYTFMITKNRWREMKSQEAHHLCKKMNPEAFVLSVRDEEENNFVTEQLHSFSGLAVWVWLGVIYDDNKVLKWYDETHLTYNNWRLGRPIIKKNSFFAGVNLDGFWDIYNYSQSWQAHHYNVYSILACKIERGKWWSPPLPEFIPHGDTTYRILQKKLTWYDAVRECKQNMSDLASVHSESQQLFLEDIVKQDGYPLWLGLSIHDGSKANFEWSDGSSFDYYPWELENSNMTENCVLLDTKGSWNRAKCTSVAEGAICYKRQSEQNQVSQASGCSQLSGELPWIQYKDHCYAFDMAFYNFSVYNIEDAKKVCKKLSPSAALLTIGDAEENAFVSTHIKKNDLITRKVWLGLTQSSKDQSLHWLDGSSVNYANWDNRTAELSERCSVIVSTSGKWSKVDCSRSQSRVVCKAPLGSNHTGVAVAFALLIILVLVVGLVWFICKKKRLHWSAFSSVHYQRGINDDEADDVFTKDGY
uniref:Lymphocyte antigen 75 n=1 Tax=Phasianus colchicus TaxID=9054 RepID=A0A669PTN9_PHACC